MYIMFLQLRATWKVTEYSIELNLDQFTINYYQMQFVNRKNAEHPVGKIPNTSYSCK